MRWMGACIFMSHLSILVNCSPTKDYEVGRGMRQGDPLSLFLFVLLVKGLTGLIFKASEKG